jgi:hypothetical protein
MAEAGPTLTRHDLEAKIVKRCWEDETFRAEFIADPAGAFTKYLEVPAAELPKIAVHEEGAGTWHIVLPARPARAGELSERDLETVAGGTGVIATLTDDLALGIAGLAGGLRVASGMISASVLSASGITASAVVSVDKGW